MTDLKFITLFFFCLTLSQFKDSQWYNTSCIDSTERATRVQCITHVKATHNATQPTHHPHKPTQEPHIYTNLFQTWKNKRQPGTLASFTDIHHPLYLLYIKNTLSYQSQFSDSNPYKETHSTHTTKGSCQLNPSHCSKPTLNWDLHITQAFSTRPCPKVQLDSILPRKCMCQWTFHQTSINTTWT